MPIQFRCTTCNQLLSISRKKAGVEILCPKCKTLTRVPQLAEVEEDVPAASPTPAPPAEPPQAKSESHQAAPAAPPKAVPPAVERKPAPPPAAPAPAAELRPAPRASEPVAPPPVQPESSASPLVREPRPVAAASRSVMSAVATSSYNPWTDVDHDEEDFHPAKKQAPPKDELDMTSLVDVTFLLLVFFMITASFTVQKFLQIAAPESDDNAAASAAAVVASDDIVGESVIVAVDEQDRIQVDDAPVASLADLKKLLETKLRDEQKTDVLIEAAYKATHGTVVAVTDVAIQAGIRHVRRASRRDADE